MIVAASMNAKFLSEPSGGDRPQAVAAALFEIIGERFKRQQEVERANINEADVAAGRVNDLQCRDDANLVMAAEVKDQELRLQHVEEKVATARAQGVTSIMFIAERDVAAADDDAIKARIKVEFGNGLNIYITKIKALTREMLSLLPEDARRDLLVRVGKQLEDSSADIKHRRAWADILKNL